MYLFSNMTLLQNVYIPYMLESESIKQIHMLLFFYHAVTYTGFPGGSGGKESACNAGDLGLIPGLGRSREEGMATHSSILAWRIPLGRGAWRAAVHGVAKIQTLLSD